MSEDIYHRYINHMSRVKSKSKKLKVWMWNSHRRDDGWSVNVWYVRMDDGFHWVLIDDLSKKKFMNEREGEGGRWCVDINQSSLPWWIFLFVCLWVDGVGALYWAYHKDTYEWVSDWVTDALRPPCLLVAYLSFFCDILLLCGFFERKKKAFVLCDKLNHPANNRHYMRIHIHVLICSRGNITGATLVLGTLNWLQTASSWGPLLSVGEQQYVSKFSTRCVIRCWTDNKKGNE